jgi:hypothetical protein
MVYYTDAPEFNKRMVAGYYLFLCLVGFAIFLGPTGSGIPITLIGDEGRYEHELASPGSSTDPEACGVSGCHEDQYNYWNDTAHPTHDLTFNGTYVIGLHGERNATYFNETCAPCHATGYDSTDDTWDSLGVDCFACHDTTTPYVTYDGEVCGNCHYPGYHANQNVYPDWALSLHANSMTDLRSSDHAASYCMHCQATEAFIHQQNPGSLSDDVDTDFAVDGDYNSISCPACHAVHSNWSISSPAQIRAVNASELCGLCHVGTHHPHYEVWIDGSHNLAGVECTDCHGYQLIFYRGSWRGTLNHTCAIDPEVACGQSEDCHEGMETWALGQLEMRGEAFDALTEEILEVATALTAEVATFNATGANITLANNVQGAIDAAVDAVHYYQYDSSKGFHDGAETFSVLNDVYAEMLEAKATFYMYSTPAGADILILALLGGGGIVAGLVLGLLLGRRQ